MAFLSGLLPGQHYSMTAEQIVDNPVPRPGGTRGLQGFYTVDRVQQRFWSSSPSFPIQVEILKIFSQSRVPQRLLSVSPGQAGERVFRTFPTGKKGAKIPRTQGSELGTESSSWTPSAQLGSGTVAQHGVQPLVQAVHGCCLSVLEASGRISCSTSCVSRCSHLEIWTLPSPLVSFSPSGVWVLSVEYVVFGTRALLGSTVDTCSTGGSGRIWAFSTLK